MAALLAAGAALLFGTLAVTIRIALRVRPDADCGALATTAVACPVCVAVAAAFGQWSHVRWADTWPFLVAGTVAPSLSPLLLTRAVALIGAPRTTIIVEN